MRSVLGLVVLNIVIVANSANHGTAFAQGSATTEKAAVAVATDAMEAPPEPSDMESIFNGVNLDGWKGDERLWTVADGAIRGETTLEKKSVGNTFLIWKDEVADFELRLSFRVSSINNSGIQYRSAYITDPAKKPNNDYVLRGYQHEIRNSGDYPDVAGFIYDEGGKRRRMCLAGEKAKWQDGKKVVESILVDAAEFKKLFKVDQWNDVVIIAKGNHIQHYMNGKLILDFTDSEETAVLKGRLGVQLHQGKPMWAEFKDMRLKHLTP